MALTSKVQDLFSRYFLAFQSHDVAAVAECYHIPCALSTPDRMVFLHNELQFDDEFAMIFQQLRQANIVNFKATQASYAELAPALLFACVDWQFIGENQQVFTHFSAFYTLKIDGEQLKIISVVSQDLASSLSLAQPFQIAEAMIEA